MSTELCAEGITAKLQCRSKPCFGSATYAPERLHRAPTQRACHRQLCRHTLASCKLQLLWMYTVCHMASRTHFTSQQTGNWQTGKHANTQIGTSASLAPHLCLLTGLTQCARSCSRLLHSAAAAESAESAVPRSQPTRVACWRGMAVLSQPAAAAACELTAPVS
jgi:hypothetical protein